MTDKPRLVAHIGGIDGPTVSLELLECEAVITRGLRGFIDVGAALAKIRDQRFYRDTHETFEEYCQKRWGWSSSRARQIIAAAEVGEAIKSVTPGNTPPTEKHVRPLVALPAEQRVDAWLEAVERAPDGRPASKVVEAVAVLRGMSKDEQRALVQDFDADVVIAHSRELRRQRTREAFHSKESAEWYSPPEPVELARTLMGAIDLDPATSPEANEVVRAARIYTAADDGLSQEWSGRVWLNWPGGLNDDDESNAKLWCDKLLAEHKAGRTTEAVVMLFNAATDRSWFWPLWDHSLCFVKGRLRFRRPGGIVGNQPLQPSGLAYLGPQVGRFAELFSKIGRIVVPVGGSLISEAMR